MKKITIKSLILFCFTCFSIVGLAQSIAPDEDTGSYTTCTEEGTNPARDTDIENPVNVGDIDDRSCYANYKESTIDTTVWGIYNITEGSNHMDEANTLQPRIERSLSRSQTTGVGSYAKFTGTLRLLEVGNTTSLGTTGTYFMQAKGKHTGGGGSNDPAICLYLAKPVYGTDGNGNQVQVSFDVYREQINYRGGEGATGRQEVFLTNIPKNEATSIVLEVGFRADPNDASKKIQYADASIGGEDFNWTIPEPERAKESGIRYGAYRVKGGRAQIRWANTTYEKKEIAEDGVDLSGDIFNLKNVATGKYLDSEGATVMVNVSNEGVDKEWEFVKAGSYYNIDSKSDKGILRAPGNDSNIINTGFSPPREDSDKQWSIIQEEDGTYRFKTKNGDAYLYNETDDTVIYSSKVDDRSKWIAESTSSLSITEKDLDKVSLKVFPNPAKENFTIGFNTIQIVNVTIYDVLGKKIYSKNDTTSKLIIQNSGKFKPGLYIIKVIGDNQNVYQSKLLIQ